MTPHEIAADVRDRAWLIATGRLAELGAEPAPTPELGDLVRTCVAVGIDAGMQALADRYTSKHLRGGADGQRRADP